MEASVKNRIDTLIKEVEQRKMFKEEPPTFLDSPALKEARDLCFSVNLNDVEELNYVRPVLRYLGHNFKIMNRVQLSVEVYNFLVKCNVAYNKLIPFTFEEETQGAYDMLECFKARNFYVYDDCTDIVDLIETVYPHREIIVQVLEEAKSSWHLGLTRDKVEMSKEYLDVIDEVDEVVAQKIKQNPQLNKWDLQKKELKKRGIEWTSPATLNSGALFD